MAACSSPQFSDGNVEIHFSNTDEKFILHSHTLALHSSWFKASLSERWNGGAEVAMLNGKNHWVYELRFDKDSAFGMLTRKDNLPETPDTDFIPGSKGVLRKKASRSEMDLHIRRLDWVKAHQGVLRALYHISPDFSDKSFAEARASMRLLATTAEMYGCEAVIKLHIDTHLNSYRAEVLELCATEPTDMLDLAIAVKSEWLFKEAATNLLGRSERSYDMAQPKLTELHIAELMAKKRRTLVARLKLCESEMFQIQPSSPEDQRDLMAVSYFRQWLSERLKAGKGSGLSPGYASIYHTIAKRRFSFNEKVKAQSFMIVLFTDFNEAGGADEKMQCLEPYFETVFADATEIIQPILNDITRRQDKRYDAHRSLLFMGVRDEELPWAKK